MRDPIPAWHVLEEPDASAPAVVLPATAGHGPRVETRRGVRWSVGAETARLALAVVAGAVVSAAAVLVIGGSPAPSVVIEPGSSGDAARGAASRAGAASGATRDPSSEIRVAQAGPGTAAGPVGGKSAAGVALIVDVEGAVARPGVVRLTSDARVGDAIAAAGGYAPSVDVDRASLELNLAAPVSDGDRVRVPAIGDPPGSDTGAVAGTAGAGAGSSGTTGRGGGAAGGTTAGGEPTGGGTALGKVDLNRATQAELDALPGIGPVTAGRILDSRATAPFQRIEELRERKLVGASVYKQVAPLIVVGP